MMPGSVRDPSTWRTGLNALSNKNQFPSTVGTGTYRVSVNDGKIELWEKGQKMKAPGGSESPWIRIDFGDKDWKLCGSAKINARHFVIVKCAIYRIRARWEYMVPCWTYQRDLTYFILKDRRVSAIIRTNLLIDASSWLFKCWRKIWASFQRVIELFTQKFVTKL
jgi:hypothetical protein